MHHKTPWANSSLPSDRIKPSPPPTRPGSAATNRGKGKESNPKSAVVRKLDELLSRLQSENSQKKDPEGGCFCLGRTHELSPYTPMCSHCGLILCFLNQPYYACPYCSSPLLTETTRALLERKVEQEISQTIVKEAEDIERAREETRRTAGEFPSLNGPGNASQSSLTAPQSSHKVLSLNSKTKRVIVSYTTVSRPTTPSTTGVDTPNGKSNVQRVPPPSRQHQYITEPIEPTRPWLNPQGLVLKYTPESKPAPTSIQKNRKKKGKESEPTRYVPGSGS